mmetsp:Transcript_44956/g.66151  ORF Transcript_44956/g.66151 Transcript_44956/m.66151 type:complete len:226 (-) Transcript_44956:227-904(-)|eukprot:CAMPEP_0195508032 /NCGR_PEP_ID=MMETSP0794_2-20130614/1345_1 /TAXON_ID=515487 /ORGANISM="Stephanopyxis turris, Strain CCMP 815" /LENGTH=225 /DNA_ID=CAMNT_0040634883 /DNA_START=31 /DNA_END=708 /DNA_ORIENTATION=-
MSCHGHSHDHDHGEEFSHSLREFIDLESIRCLNENTANSAKLVVKDQKTRFSTHPNLQSQVDGDPELIVYVPFTEAVTITSISIAGPEPSTSSDGTGLTACPRKVKLFVDKEDIDFDDAEETPPAMEFDLVHPNHQHDDEEIGTVDYPLRPAGRFQNVGSITLYFPENFGLLQGDDLDYQTEITYLGFKGKGTSVKRRAVEAVYETRGMKKDHKVPDEMNSRFGV